jgi:mRNA interferase MazF
MKSGNPPNFNFKSGDVVLAFVQFLDSEDIKARPALILFEEFNNFVIAGITSNPNMEGIPVTVEDGAIKPSVIKLNYIFTISTVLIKKFLFRLPQKKRELVYEEFTKKLAQLKGEN